jgi:hypothetical protein
MSSAPPASEIPSVDPPWLPDLVSDLSKTLSSQLEVALKKALKPIYLHMDYLKYQFQDLRNDVVSTPAEAETAVYSQYMSLIKNAHLRIFDDHALSIMLPTSFTLDASPELSLHNCYVRPCWLLLLDLLLTLAITPCPNVRKLLTLKGESGIWKSLFCTFLVWALLHFTDNNGVSLSFFLLSLFITSYLFVLDFFCRNLFTSKYFGNLRRTLPCLSNPHMREGLRWSAFGV